VVLVVLVMLVAQGIRVTLVLARGLEVEVAQEAQETLVLMGQTVIQAPMERVLHQVTQGLRARLETTETLVILEHQQVQQPCLLWPYK
jgi:hypothetical protein